MVLFDFNFFGTFWVAKFSIVHFNAVLCEVWFLIYPIQLKAAKFE